MLFLCGMVVAKNFRGSFENKTTKGFYRAFLFFLFVLVGGIALLWPAFYNKFPLYYSDTGAYIGFGDLRRSIGYNYFISITTFRISIWLAVFAQSLITSFLLLRASIIILKDIRFKEVLAFMILICVILLTDIAKYPSWLIPDIFASWILLGGTLFFLSPKWYDNLLGKNAIGLAMFCHNGNILIAIVAFLLLSIIGYVYRSKIPQILSKVKKLTVYIILTLISICMLNYYSGRGFELFPPQKTTFLMAKFISYGVVSKTLDRYCPSKRWELCKYENKLKALTGKSLGFIMWSPRSFYKKAKIRYNEMENEEIVIYSFKSDPLEIFIYSLRDVFRLMVNFDSMAGMMQRKSDWLYNSFKRSFPGEFRYFLNSRQAQGLPVKVRIFSFNDTLIQIYIFACTLMVILLFLWKREYIHIITIASVCTFIFLNDFLTASISAPAARFSMRVLWLVPYSLFLIVLNFLGKENSTGEWR
jgi:hypothetical protein